MVNPLGVIRRLEEIRGEVREERLQAEMAQEFLLALHDGEPRRAVCNVLKQRAPVPDD